MKIDVLTLFPEMFEPLKSSIIGRAVKDGKVELNITDIRAFSEDKHKKCDDAPFGGGAGMVMTPQPIASAINFLDKDHAAKRIYLSPKGEKLSQNMVVSLSREQHILLLCGHYEGVDQRVLDLFIDEEISLGDFVLTGGEIPAMALVDAVSRYVDGVINQESLAQESFSSGMLEYPHYTRPQEFMGIAVPEVLRGGNHAEIDKWRAKKSTEITQKNRPDLLGKEE